MPRILGSQVNTVHIRDMVCGDVHEIRYRMPTNAERVQYMASLVRRTGGKSESRMFEARVEFGAKVITGFRKGTFATSMGTIFSSDERDPDYSSDWRALMEEGAPEILATVAEVAFDGAAAIHPAFVEEDDPREDPPK